MSERVETEANRPRIAKNDAARIRRFVLAVEELQKLYSVEICTESDSIALRDTRRKDDWQGYGEWDAFIFNAGGGYRMRARSVVIEDFESWGK